MAIFLNGNNDIRSIHYNGVDLTSVTFNDVIVWRKGSVLSNISNLAVHSVSYTSVILSYTLPKDATGVKIYCNTVSDVSSSNYIKVIDSLADTCEISSLSVNTTYYFAAYAYNSLTTSAPSNIVNAKTLSISTTAIQDWKYILDNSKNKVTLTEYIGTNNSTLTIHPFYNINGKNYKTYITNLIFRFGNNKSGLSKIRKIVFENEVCVDSDFYYTLNGEKVHNLLESLFWSGNGGEDFSSLEEIDISGLNVQNITDVSCMFVAPRLKTIKGLSVFKNNHSITDFKFMFRCPSLTSLDVSSLNTENAVNLSAMFSDCKQLQSLDLRNFDTSKAKKMDYMFQYCPKLRYVYVSDKWDTSSANTEYMFLGCPAQIVEAT